MQLDELLPYCNHRPDGDIEAPSFTTPWSLSLPKMSYSDCCPYRFVSHFEIHVNRSIQYIFSSIASLLYNVPLWIDHGLFAHSAVVGHLFPVFRYYK